jgi:predicted RNA-binding protein with TRAM domain
MLDISERLRSLFTGVIQESGDSYVIEVPQHEIDHDAVQVGDRYRVALIDAAEPTSTGTESDVQQRQSRVSETSQSEQLTPPVEEGEVRQVSVETTGDQGDGIAKVERGYVVISPDPKPGEQQPSRSRRSSRTSFLYRSSTTPARSHSPL